MKKRPRAIEREELKPVSSMHSMQISRARRDDLGDGGEELESLTPITFGWLSSCRNLTSLIADMSNPSLN
jgi:hypothetical protein